MKVRQIARRSAPIAPSTTGAAVYSMFSADPALMAIAVVDGSRPVGLIARGSFTMRMADRFGRALFEKRPVTFVMNKSFIALDGDSYVAEANALVLQRDAADLLDGFIVTLRGEYFGVAVGYDLLSATADLAERSTQRLSLALEVAEAAVWEIDLTTWQLTGADALSAVFGAPVSIEWFANGGLRASVYHEDRDKVSEAVAALKARPTRLAIEHRCVGVDGKMRWIHHAVESFGEPGAVAKVLALSTDITERKRTESALADALSIAEETLAHKSDMLASVMREKAAPTQLARGPAEGAVVDRFGRVLQQIDERDRAIAQALDAADRANKLKSAFLANVSHELRTPLNAIIGYSELIEEEAALDGQTREDIGRVLSNARHLVELINNLLQLSKIEAGKEEARYTAFDVGALIREAVDVVAPLAARNGDQLRIEVDEKLGDIHSDRTKLKQCLLNLLSNACKFTKDGVIAIRAHAAPTHVVIQVQDTGVGMTEAQQKRIFEPFTQADASIAESHGGTGLGLSITRRFAQMLGGDVTVKSRYGEGSVFTLTIAAPASVRGLEAA